MDIEILYYSAITTLDLFVDFKECLELFNKVIMDNIKKKKSNYKTKKDYKYVIGLIKIDHILNLI